jgi:hypothetical protein
MRLLVEDREVWGLEWQSGIGRSGEQAVLGDLLRRVAVQVLGRDQIARIERSSCLRRP